MKSIARLLLGLVLLPACWGLGRVFVDAVFEATGFAGGFSVDAIALLAGMALFSLSWCAIPLPVRAYVLGHELTHALWGLIFGAHPSNVKVGENGGSVTLTKTNMLITLAPYFFPFWTFVVIVAGLVTYAFLRPLPYMPLWMFAIGFTWAFHVLFTIKTLTVHQSDITIYGRIFSWSFIFMANVALVLVWLACATPVTFADLLAFSLERIPSAYMGVAGAFAAAFRWVASLMRG